MPSNAVATGTGAPQLLLSVNGQLMRSDVLLETAAGAGALIAFNDLHGHLEPPRMALNVAAPDGSGQALNGMRACA